MAKELFGQYLIRKGMVSQEDLDEALILQEILHDSLGAVALANDLINYRDVGRILDRVDKSGEGFADSAVALGILSRKQVNELRNCDEAGRIRIGQLLVATAQISRPELEKELARFSHERRLMASPNVTRAGLVEEISERCGLQKSVVRQSLEALLETISESLGQGKEIKLRGFGTFRIRRFPARKARNPRTGDTMNLAPRTTAHIEFARQLKKMVEKGKGN